ncbi:MAG: hypothetical protein ACJAZF_002727 [Granulosicoccus sp.]
MNRGGHTDLTYTVKMGVLARAQRHFESTDVTQPTFKIASTLLASGGYGVSVGLSAQHIPKGVLKANRTVREINSTYNNDDLPVVSHLRLVELYWSPATEAWLALNDLSNEISSNMSITLLVKLGPGAMKRLDQHGYRGTGSDILNAIAQDHSQILYTVATKRARAKVRAQST